MDSMSRRERKKIETKAGILAAARHLFQEKGFEATSIEEITERADVSKATFFNYFASKESLISGIAEDEVDDILILADEELGCIDSPIEKIRAIMRRMLEDAVPYLYLAGRVVFSSVINTDGEPSPFYKINCLLEDLVRDGQNRHEITERFSAPDIATIIMGGYLGVLFKWFELGCKPGSADELEPIIDILLKGMENTL
jgi:AcrR family transcriptional regulator